MTPEQRRGINRLTLTMADTMHPLAHVFGPRCGWTCEGNRKARDFREAIRPGARR